MKYSIVYSSVTGNTKQLAQCINEQLKDDVIYCGTIDDKALEADRIYIGFWTDKGTCDEKIASFIKTIKNKEVFIFGTAGFGGDPEYFDGILGRVKENLDSSNTCIGEYMCQGKMPSSVKERYLKMLEDPNHKPFVQASIDNYEKALTHPDTNDLDNLRKLIKDAINK